MTYNGQWGATLWQSTIPKSNDMSVLTAALKNSKFCERLWQQARLEATSISARVQADDHTVCLDCAGVNAYTLFGTMLQASGYTA